MPRIKSGSVRPVVAGRMTEEMAAALGVSGEVMPLSDFASLAAPARANDEAMIDEIIVPERLRPVDGDWVEALAVSMEEHGLDNPITVRLDGDSLVLVAGAHRLAAAKMLGWTSIRYDLREMDALQARLVEIDENLMRRELSMLDRAIFLAERKRVWEERFPETKHGGDRRSKKAKQGVKSSTLRLEERFTKNAARATGLSEATIQKACALAAALSPEAIAALRATGIADNAAELKLLAGQSSSEQRAAADLIITGQAKTVKAAFQLTGALQLPQSDPEEILLSKLVDLWSRAKPRTRRRFTAHIGLSGEVV